METMSQVTERSVVLPGRGTTFIREAPGPARSPTLASPRPQRNQRSELAQRVRFAQPLVSLRRNRPPRTRARNRDSSALPARRLRRRLGTITPLCASGAGYQHGDARDECATSASSAAPNVAISRETASKLRSLGIRSIVFDPCANRPATGDFLSAMRANLVAVGAAQGERVE